MARKKLKYRFHNPNSVEATADYILKVFIEVNGRKVDKILRETMNQRTEEDACNEGNPNVE